MGYGFFVKMTFDIADEIGERFTAVVPRGNRSKVVAELIQARLESLETDLDEVCRKANKLNLDLTDWEKLNESQAW
jgi:hypothetical protein